MRSMHNSPTCGARYKAVADQLFPCRGDLHGLDTLILRYPEGPPGYACFALGFMVGQAEKTCAGACDAFMVRPAAPWLLWAQAAMALVCSHYGLIVESDEAHGELWGYVPPARDALMTMLDGVTNSPAWHTQRAALCGIPADRVDTAHHERDTWGLRCEPDVTGDPSEEENT